MPAAVRWLTPRSSLPIAIPIATAIAIGGRAG
ncbi:hypothetical protein SAVIM338S_01085 [Streptomyces avidinii]